MDKPIEGRLRGSRPMGEPTAERSPLEFGVLGPLEVRVGGRELRLASPKHRVLLARLLLDNGRPVATAALVEAIWGDDRPASPKRAVQVCIHRLRSELAVLSQSQLIVTCPDGYRITVPPGQFDLARFESWVRNAQRAADDGDLEREAAALVAALEQWRGEPLVDVPSESLQARMIPRLTEKWLQTFERRIECDLRLGKHAELVSELREVTARYPSRTRPWTQLIRALDSSGRRTEALEAYHSVRSHMTDELGVEPDRELRRLHANLLVGRADELRPPEAAIPRQLPPSVHGFVGRLRETARLDRLLAQIHDGRATEARIAVVSGTAGVGKTALVARWTRLVADHFPDGQLWVNLRGYDQGQSLRPAQVLARFLGALGVQGEHIGRDLEDLCAHYRSLLDGRRMLVVLDNADSADQIQPLLPGGPGCLVVVTSRSQLTELVAADGAVLIDVDLFSRHEARQLLEKRTGTDRVTAQPQAAEVIIDRCAGLPLALSIVGARAAAQPHLSLATTAAQFHDTPAAALDVLSTGESGIDVRTVFSWSLSSLSPGAARLFRLLGLHPGSALAAFAAASVAGVPLQQARSQLSELTKAHLLFEPEAGRYLLHDLLHAYARELAGAAEPEADRKAAEQRMLDHYLHTATTAAEQLYPTVRRVPLGDPRMGTSVRPARDRDEALNWFTREQTTLLDLVNYGSDEHTWRLAATLGPYLEGRGYWHDREDTARTGVAAATRLENPTAQAFSHGSLASAYLQYPTPGSYMVAGGSQQAARSSRLEAANTHLRHATDSFLRADDLIGLAFTYIQVCCLHEERGQFQEALKAARQALDAFADADDPLGQAFATNATGLYLAKLGNYEQALPMCEQAAAQLEELGNHDGWAATCDSLGYIHHKLGNYTVAVGWYDRTIEHFRTVGHRYSEAYSTIGLGDTFNTAGDIPAARAAWQRAFDILTEINHPDAQYVSDILTASADTSGGVTAAPSDR